MIIITAIIIEIIVLVEKGAILIKILLDINQIGEVIISRMVKINSEIRIQKEKRMRKDGQMNWIKQVEILISNKKMMVALSILKIMKDLEVMKIRKIKKRNKENIINLILLCFFFLF